MSHRFPDDLLVLAALAIVFTAHGIVLAAFVFPAIPPVWHRLTR